MTAILCVFFLSANGRPAVSAKSNTGAVEGRHHGPGLTVTVGDVMAPKLAIPTPLSTSRGMFCILKRGTFWNTKKGKLEEPVAENNRPTGGIPADEILNECGRYGSDWFLVSSPLLEENSCRARHLCAGSFHFGCGRKECVPSPL
jgi:hypothetical protein